MKKTYVLLTGQLLYEMAELQQKTGLRQSEIMRVALVLGMRFMKEALEDPTLDAKELLRKVSEKLSLSR